jgi:hypothetical protein
MVNRSGLERSALPIRDPEILSFIKKVDTNNFFTKSLQDLTIRERFIKEYFKWVQTSKLNKLRGIKKFKYLSYVHGTSQSFDFFYAENNKRRFRCFKGDFFYHVLSWKRNYRFSYLNNGNIRKNDAVIISIPFSDNGFLHDRTLEVLEMCDLLDVPVMIDLSYYNLVRDLDFNLNRPSIKSITFSLSKSFYPLDRLRVGIRCKREFTDDPVDIFNSFDMFNKAGASLGLKIIKKFLPDHNQIKFGKKQQEICSKFDLEPSKCVIFGLGDKRFKEFNRGARWNRVCLSPLLIK